MSDKNLRKIKKSEPVSSPERSKGLPIDGLTILFFLMLAFLIYSNSLYGDFVFDDTTNIRDNPHIRISHITFQNLLDAGFKSYAGNRPVANISFALNYYFHGYKVFGYHVLNIFIHAISAFLLFLLCRSILSLQALQIEKNSPHLIAWFTAALWLVHPIQTQSVAYIVQRMNSMASLFYLLALGFYITGRRLSSHNYYAFGCYFFSLASGILAMGSKEIAVTLPFFILLIEWYFFQNMSFDWIYRNRYPFGLLVLFIMLCILIFLGLHPLDTLLKGYQGRDFTMGQRILTEFRVIIFYIFLFLFPHPNLLNIDHDFQVSRSLIDPPTTIIAIGMILAMTIGGIYFARKQRLLSFCILWFLGNLAIESSFIGLEIIFEHRTYLPSMMICLMVVYLVFQYIPSKRIGVALLSVGIIIFCIWTYQRNSVWQNDLTLWTDSAKKSPNKSRTQYNLAVALEDRGRLDEAMTYYRKAIHRDPINEKAHNNLGYVLGRMGRYPEAMTHYQRALALKPDYAMAHNNLGLTYAGLGDHPEAVMHFSKAIEIDPSYDKAHNNIALSLYRLGRQGEAIDHLSRALEIEPDYIEAHNNIANILSTMGQFDQALNHYQKALRIQPDNADIHFNMGLIFLNRAQYPEAKDQFMETLRLAPEHPKARHYLNRLK